MPDRSRLRHIRRLAFGFGAGIAGGWLAGLLRKPTASSSSTAAPGMRPEPTRVRAAQTDPSARRDSATS